LTSHRALRAPALHQPARYDIPDIQRPRGLCAVRGRRSGVRVREPGCFAAVPDYGQADLHRASGHSNGTYRSLLERAELVHRSSTRPVARVFSAGKLVCDMVGKSPIDEFV
jgi:hypothetical protein